ncbi:hypothetical protein ACH4GE_36720 [Streptomyces tendae]|uniref:hypothetical protein n=1 Tax=Streptomyces tendae TaxID=1932 RepID=UPI003799E1DC
MSPDPGRAGLPPAVRLPWAAAHPEARRSLFDAETAAPVARLGVTVVPASAVPEGFEDLACPPAPSLTEPVLVGVRRDPGPAEAAMLDHLDRQNWCGTGLLLHRSATD